MTTLMALATVSVVSCDKHSPTGPSGNDSGLRVTSVTPGSGTTLGGTTVTIAGAGFGAGATVLIGGAGATNVVVVSDTAITATTPQHASGSADVVVSAGGKSGTLRGGYSFSAPGRMDNQAPVIAGITAKGRRRNEPGGFADLDEPINVVANVTDAETPIDQLHYEWSSSVGSFAGDGPTVTWMAPHDARTPQSYDLTLTVTEEYQTTDDAGLPVTKQNRVSQTVSISLHDSAHEISEMAYEFLDDFSHSNIPTSTVMRNFTNACRGTSDEASQVDDNRHNFDIYYHTVANPDTKVNFRSNCPFRDRGPVDACSEVKVEWRSNPLVPTEKKQQTVGTDQVTAVYLNNRWWLCDSDIDGTVTILTSGLR